MCEICEGASDDEVLFGIYGRIHRFGWTIEYVQGPTVRESWGYTIGLTERFGHPELAIAKRCPEHTAQVINAIGREISLGRVIPPGGVIRCGDEDYRLVNVHLRHYELGTFGMWDFYYRSLGRRPADHCVLEIALPGERGVFVDEPDDRWGDGYG